MPGGRLASRQSWHFYTLVEAKAFSGSHTQPCKIFSIDKTTKGNKFFTVTTVDKLPFLDYCTDRHRYEILEPDIPTRLYMDIDWPMSNGSVPLGEIIEGLWGYLGSEVEDSIAKAASVVNIRECYVFESKKVNATKYSYHLTFPHIILPCVKTMGGFAMMKEFVLGFVEFLREKRGIDVSIWKPIRGSQIERRKSLIDTLVYSRDQNFRMCGQSKKDSRNPFVHICPSDISSASKEGCMNWTDFYNQLPGFQVTLSEELYRTIVPATIPLFETKCGKHARRPRGRRDDVEKGMYAHLWPGRVDTKQIEVLRSGDLCELIDGDVLRDHFTTLFLPALTSLVTSGDIPHDKIVAWCNSSSRSKVASWIRDVETYVERHGCPDPYPCAKIISIIEHVYDITIVDRRQLESWREDVADLGDPWLLPRPDMFTMVKGDEGLRQKLHMITKADSKFYGMANSRRRLFRITGNMGSGKTKGLIYYLTDLLLNIRHRPEASLQHSEYIPQHKTHLSHLHTITIVCPRIVMVDQYVARLRNRLHYLTQIHPSLKRRVNRISVRAYHSNNTSCYDEWREHDRKRVIARDTMLKLKHEALVSRQDIPYAYPHILIEEGAKDPHVINHPVVNVVCVNSLYHLAGPPPDLLVIDEIVMIIGNMFINNKPVPDKPIVTNLTTLLHSSRMTFLLEARMTREVVEAFTKLWQGLPEITSQTIDDWSTELPRITGMDVSRLNQWIRRIRETNVRKQHNTQQSNNSDDRSAGSVNIILERPVYSSHTCSVWIEQIPTNICVVSVHPPIINHVVMYPSRDQIVTHLISNAMAGNKVLVLTSTQSQAHAIGSAFVGFATAKGRIPIPPVQVATKDQTRDVGYPGILEVIKRLPKYNLTIMTNVVGAGPSFENSKIDDVYLLYQPGKICPPLHDMIQLSGRARSVTRRTLHVCTIGGPMYRFGTDDGLVRSDCGSTSNVDPITLFANAHRKLYGQEEPRPLLRAYKDLLKEVGRAYAKYHEGSYQPPSFSLTTVAHEDVNVCSRIEITQRRTLASRFRDEEFMGHNSHLVAALEKQPAKGRLNFDNTIDKIVAVTPKNEQEGACGEVKKKRTRYQGITLVPMIVPDEGEVRYILTAGYRNTRKRLKRTDT
ncbi:PREDICTED: uncharacterized protein LOC109473278 [Branchiostoma belcheri]|uniref:Uncharacterized protein LOC109473278 n=1 Tax=Branchiostoma belcheri TaxID=7741 RepID=A0A6P4ZC94_BRABE|nr:PREDICTED: uncharacterized protein LOC109473278 [Branchiostoma belcheri]